MKFIKRFLSWLLSFFIKPKPQPHIGKPGDALKLLPGYELNPFLKYPRNMNCYCGSGLKYKRCCISTDPLAIPKEAADQARALIKKLR
jgi:hypothetical protein